MRRIRQTVNARLCLSSGNRIRQRLGILYRPLLYMGRHVLSCSLDNTELILSLENTEYIDPRILFWRLSRKSHIIHS